MFQVSLSVSGASVNVKAVRHGSAGSIEGALPADLTAPYAMESFVPYGIFTESGPTSLLQYYTTASEVSAPNDWFSVQDELKNVFEVTLRDPYMKVSNKGGSVGAPDFKDDGSCPNGESEADGMACVVAVIRFNGEPVTASPLNVTVFDESGSAIGVTECAGACNVKVPKEGRVFAAVQLKEMEPGTFDGTDYEYVDHWATTTTTIDRK